MIVNWEKNTKKELIELLEEYCEFIQNLNCVIKKLDDKNRDLERQKRELMETLIQVEVIAIKLDKSEYVDDALSILKKLAQFQHSEIMADDNPGWR